MSKKNKWPSASSSAPAFPWRPVLAAGIALLALALFWPATGFDFINFDDPNYVRDNPHVNTGFSLDNIRWAFSPHENWWLPLLWISFMLDAVLFGPGPFGPHLVNVLLHAANAALLFWAFSRMLKSVWIAAFVAALFAVHPMRVEAVAWVTARKDVLSGLFYMLALLAYLRHVERPSAPRLWLVAALMLLGLLSKAILITLPPILLLLDFWPFHRAGDPLDRREWKNWGPLLLEKWPLILLAAIFVPINLHTHISGSGAHSALSAGTRLGLIPPNFWAYLGKIIWPHPLSIVYPEHDVVVPWITALALLGLVFTTVALFRIRSRHPALIVGWLWFLVALLPVVRGIRLGIASITDRFTYIPAIGLFLMLAIAIVDWLPAVSWRRPVLAAAAFAILAACFVAARAYLLLWTTPEPLYLHGLAVTQDNLVLNINLAAVYNGQNRRGEEIRQLHNVLEIDPGHASAHAILAKALRETGAPEEALPHLDQAIRHVRSLEWEVMTIIGEECAFAHRLPEAIRYFRSALQIQPGRTNNILNLATALVLSGQPREALAQFDEYFQTNPRNDHRALFFRGQALLALKRPDEALPSLQAATDLLPGKIEYQSQLAIALSAVGRDSEAVALFRKLLRANPESPELLNNLACILAENPASPVYDPATALTHALRAAELTDHQDPNILDTLVMAHAANAQCHLALQIAAKAELLASRLEMTDLAKQIQARAKDCRKSPEPKRARPDPDDQ